VLVRGVPLEQTEFWDRARPGSQAGLPALLESAGLRARPVALEVVRGEPARLRAALDESRGGAVVCVCDAESEDDLDRIAAAGLADGHTLFAGSAGLAHSLAERAAPVASVVVKPAGCGASTRGALLVVGSQAQPSRAALAAATAVRGVRAHTVSAADLLGSPELAVPVAGLIAAIEDGVDVVIDVAPPAADPPTPAPPTSAPPTSAPLMVDALARRLAPLAQAASALMATGGDTASALLRHADVRGIRLVDELEPGTSLGLTLGALTKPVITKSGGFGDAGSLLRILERLRSIRLTGTVA
jgi:D-threonate/D-erythronate kinase